MESTTNIHSFFFDTETTGIDTRIEKIVELAAYDPIAERSFHTYINPLQPIPLSAQRVHHISDEMVKDAPTFKEAIADFIEFCRGNDPDATLLLVGHNVIAFDRVILEVEAQRHAVLLPTFHYLDTLPLARKLLPKQRSYRLQVLREQFQIKEDGAHTALGDCRVLAKVFDRITNGSHPTAFFNTP